MKLRKCKYFKIKGLERHCNNGANDFDGLCSIEACPRHPFSIIRIMGLHMFLWYRKRMNSIYCRKYDSMYNYKNRRWTEKKYDDPDCEYCNRPRRHPKECDCLK